MTQMHAEVRISFLGSGHWSFIGTDALRIPKNQQTMNFSGFTAMTEEEELKRVVPHEFGHMLGCIHEHQNPSASINWNKEEVYKYYERFGWGKELVERNIFRTYERSQAKFSEFDSESIMLYSIPKELTTDGFSVDWNRSLSTTDKKFISIVYPKQFQQARLTSLKCISTLGGGTDNLILKIYGEDFPRSEAIYMVANDHISLDDVPPITLDKDGNARIDLQVHHADNQQSLGKFLIEQAEQGEQIHTFRSGSAVYELGYKIIKMEA